MSRSTRRAALHCVGLILSLMGPPLSAKDARVVSLEGLAQILGSNGAAAAMNLADGQILFAHRADQPAIPASTIKVCVASLALKRWGRGYRFPTEFYLDESGNLIVRGLGDPLWVSEEITLAAKGLQAAGLRDIARVVVDDTYFAQDLLVPGSVRDDEPYNACVNALSANFNSILLMKTAKGHVVSGEGQTPLTPLARSMQVPSKSGYFRHNLPPENHAPAVQAGQILVEKLKSLGLQPASSEVTPGQVPPGLSPFYVYRSSKRLCQVISLLMKHSNNVVANQIFLAMAADAAGPPATLESAAQVMQNRLKEQFGIEGIHIREGSGLSRENTITPLQMCEVLRGFCAHKDLLPQKEGVSAKTGTLTGVRCLAGYFALDDGTQACFAILLSSESQDRWALARDLRAALSTSSVQ